MVLATAAAAAAAVASISSTLLLFLGLSRGLRPFRDTGSTRGPTSNRGGPVTFQAFNVAARAVRANTPDDHYGLAQLGLAKFDVLECHFNELTENAAAACLAFQSKSWEQQLSDTSECHASHATFPKGMLDGSSWDADVDTMKMPWESLEARMKRTLSMQKGLSTQIHSVVGNGSAHMHCEHE